MSEYRLTAEEKRRAIESAERLREKLESRTTRGGAVSHDRVEQVAEAIFLADRAHFGHALKEWTARGESEQRYWCDLATAAMAAVDDYCEQQR